MIDSPGPDPRLGTRGDPGHGNSRLIAGRRHSQPIDFSSKKKTTTNIFSSASRGIEVAQQLAFTRSWRTKLRDSFTLWPARTPTCIYRALGGRYLAIARRGKEAANERRSCPATHVHHKVVVANKELTCFILCHRDVLCLLLFFFSGQRMCG